MPGKDGTGPRGGGGQGGGRGIGAGRGSAGRPWGAGPGGNCVCPSCGAMVPHERGVPCTGQDCPKCGTKMVRQ
jgi:hypothetical protein